MAKKWPQEDKLYYDSMSGNFAVVDCMGGSLTFYTSENNYKGVMDTYWFIAGFDEVI